MAIPDIRDDLPMSMAMAAFAGISWYIGAELNVSLFLLFKRRRGLYFWSCALSSWGVILQPLFIVLADFGVWTELKGSITLIYLTWVILVVPQSWVLYSRLHLIMRDDRSLRWILGVLVFNSIVFSVPTIIIGILAQATNTNPNLSNILSIWDRVQLTVFFVQESCLSLTYIHQTRRNLRDCSPLLPPARDPTLPPISHPSSSSTNNVPRDQPDGKMEASASSTSLSSDRSASEQKVVLRHLIYTNLLIIFLDVALLSIQYANLFYLQGAFKPCIYGVKLKTEFVILNRLVRSVKERGSGETWIEA